VRIPISVRIVASQILKRNCEKSKGVTLRDWKEAIIFVTAREGEHLRQRINAKKGREDKVQRRIYKTLMKYRGAIILRGFC
jgi:hypothetical protein